MRPNVPPSRAVDLPLDTAYKFIEQGEPYKVGDYIRTNWLGAFYRLGKSQTPTDHTGDDVIQYYSVIKGDALYAIADGYINYSFDVGPVAWGWLVTLDFALPIDITVTELDRKNLSQTTRVKLPANYPLTARYAHMDTVIVEQGQWVKSGQKIGTVGDAHGLFAPHLHLDIAYTDILDTWPREWPGLDLKTIALNYLAPGEFLRDYSGWRAAPMALTKRTVRAGILAYQKATPNSPVMRIYTADTDIEVDDANAILDLETKITMVPTPTDNWIPAALVGLPEIVIPDPPPPAPNDRYVNTPGDVLNLRKTGSSTGQIIATLPHRTKVSVLALANAAGYDQVSVVLNGQTLQGYVADRFLVLDRP